MMIDQTPTSSATASTLDRLRFVLVEPSRPGNVGAAARAMKTMGLRRLVLVNPRYADVLSHEEAIAFASGAQDVLSAAQIVQTFDEAVEGCRFAAAVSARLREFSPPVTEPRAFAEEQASSEGQTAVLFGNERYGLPNEMVERCNVLITIPADPDYSSLNLAQAVQVLAYECRQAAQQGAPQPANCIGFAGQRADVPVIEGMFAHLEAALLEIGFLDPKHPKKLMPRLRRLFSRTQLEVEEVNILRGIARHIQLFASQRGKVSDVDHPTRSDP